MILEGFSERKKTALENFLKNYEAKDELDTTREELLKYRSEMDKIKENMNNDHANLSNLKI